MQAQLIQTHSCPGALYDVLQNNTMLYKASVEPSFTRLKAVLQQDGRELYSIYGGDWLYQAQKPGIKDPGKSQNKVCEIRSPHGEAIGRILHEPNVFSTPLYKIELNSQQWTVYMVGKGRQGLKFPIYDANEKQIALMEKDVFVKNNLDRYDLYALDQTGILISTLFGIYYDWKDFRNQGEFRAHKASVSITFSLKKSVKDKYDPSFKARCLGE